MMIVVMKYMILKNKKKKICYKTINFNLTNLTILIIITTIFLLIYDYCSNNFDIDLEEEYKNYKESDLMFGKKIYVNMLVINIFIILLFKSENKNISIIVYYYFIYNIFDYFIFYRYFRNYSKIYNK